VTGPVAGPGLQTNPARRLRLCGVFLWKAPRNRCNRHDGGPEGGRVGELAKSPEYLRVRKGLSRVRDAWRRVATFEGLLLTIALVGGVLFCAVALEATLHLAGWLRLILLLTVLGGTAASLALLVVRPALGEISDERVAVHIERAFPELQNGLINSVQLVKTESSARGFVAMVVADAAERSEGLEIARAVDRSRLKRLGAVALIAAALVAGLYAVSPRRFENAVMRLLHPGSFIPTQGAVKIDRIEPGDFSVLAGAEVPVKAVIRPIPGSRPEGRIIYRRRGGNEEAHRMRAVDAKTYIYPLRNIREEVRYRIEIGDSQTQWYVISVVERPEIMGLDLLYHYPEFAALPERTEENATGDIRAPVGTNVRFTVKVNKPVAEAWLQLSTGVRKDLAIDGKGLSAREWLKLTESCTYTINVADSTGKVNQTPVPRHIVAEADRAPEVKIAAPGNSEVALKSDCVISVLANDDYRLRSVRIRYRRNDKGEELTLHEWRQFTDARSAALGHKWRIDSRNFEYGDRIIYHAEATDRSTTSRSREFTLKVEDPKKKLEAKLKDLEEILARVKVILARQKTARERTKLVARVSDATAVRIGAEALRGLQLWIRDETLRTAKSAGTDDPIIARIRAALVAVAGAEMGAAVLAAESVLASAPASAKAERKEHVTRLGLLQEEIIKKLTAMLAVLPEIIQHTQEEAEEDDGADLPDDVVDKLKDLKDTLEDFKDEQKKVLAATRDLTKTPVDDLTEEEKNKLEALEALEDKWETFLKDAHSDLSKLPKQDFTDSKLLEELVEVFSEVEMAEGALAKKSAEIAVPVEQAGLELAESMTTHIEKWLPDTPDRDQWSMEEPVGEYETPMAELPTELEDLIGDLMEEEEDIFEEMEDVTSSWADSIDKGAGWDAMDGPISNMSAQGVTGNRLPNSSEIGGRSGEGRTGKAAGEFVEDTATGKGGRRTPSRLTPDSYLKGEIKDTSEDPAGGATGGGKIGGAGGEGLEGPPPPDVKREMERLSGRQAELLNRAERIALNMKLMNHPTTEIEKTIQRMRLLQSDLKDGRYINISRQRKVVIKGLGQTKEFVEGVARIARDRSDMPASGLDAEVLDAMGSSAPKGYEEILRAYYHAIGSGGGGE